MNKNQGSLPPTPPSVVAFWLVLGFSILLFILYQIQNGEKIVEALVKFVPAVTGVLSALVAYRALQLTRDLSQENRNNRRDDILRRRPYFTFLHGDIGKKLNLEYERFVGVRSSFENTGRAPCKGYNSDRNIPL